jgi:hypothetical protein
VTLNVLTSAVIVAGFSLSVLFVILYFALARWNANSAARALMLLVAGLGLVLFPLMLRHPFNFSTSNSEAFTWFQIACIALADCGVGWMLGVLIRVQARGRKSRGQHREGGDDGS